MKRLNTVPAAVSSFIGRQSELDDLAARCAEPGLVTLWGPPGVGKTRLAQEVAGRPVEDREVLWVEMAPLDRGADMLAAIANVAGVHEHSDRQLVDALATRLRARPMLLVADNCEHIVASCTELFSTLVEQCSELTVLATSRQRLHVDNEQLVALEALTARDAERLFYERASAAAGGLDVDDESAAAVTEVCGRLQGLPLAIELAAGRLGVLTPIELAERLADDPLNVLGGAGRDAPGHHDTLRAAFDWSYETLDEREATLLARLSVFRGGWTPQAARAVCSDGPVAPTKVAGLLRSLASKSLVVRRRNGRGVRYDLLDTVRHYVAARLSRDESYDLAVRHGEWCVELAETLEPQLTGPNQLTALATVDAEHHNLAAGFTRLMDHDSEAALRLASSLTIWWKVRGRFSEGREWLHSALDSAPDASDRLRARGLWALGTMTAGQDDQAAEPILKDALALAETVGDVGLQGRCMAGLGLLGFGTASEVLATFARAGELARSVGDEWCEALVLARSAYIATGTGEYTQANLWLNRAFELATRTRNAQGLLAALDAMLDVRGVYQDLAWAHASTQVVLKAARALRDPVAIVEATLTLGWIDFARGRTEDAKRFIDDGRVLAQAVDIGHLVVRALIALGYTCLANGEAEVARSHFQEAAELCSRDEDRTACLRGLGLAEASCGDLALAQRLLDLAVDVALRHSTQSVAPALSALARVARVLGEDERALALRRRSLSIRRREENRLETLACLRQLGIELLRTGQHRPAATILGKCTQAATALDFGEKVVARTTASAPTLRAALGDRAFTAAWTRGWAMSMDDAVRIGLKSRRRNCGATAGWSSLSGREQEVIRLLAAGYSNTDIAQHLVLAIRTIENMLPRIYRKVGVTSRGALERAAAERTKARDNGSVARVAAVQDR